MQISVKIDMGLKNSHIRVKKGSRDWNAECRNVVPRTPARAASAKNFQPNILVCISHAWSLIFNFYSSVSLLSSLSGVSAFDFFVVDSSSSASACPTVEVPDGVVLQVSQLSSKGFS